MKNRTLRSITALEGIESRKVDASARSIDIICSTELEDGHGTVIEQSWDLTRYKKNPVVLFEHGYASGFLGGPAAEKVPIARAEKVRVEDGKLKARFVFPAEGRSDLSDAVWKALEDGRLNAASVGFRPGKVTKEELEGGRVRYRLSKNVLHEVSIVALPSNPECVAERSMLAKLVGMDRRDDDGDFDECDVEVCVGPDCDDKKCGCSCHTGRALPMTHTTAMMGAQTAPSRENRMFLDLLAKRYGCPVTEADVLSAIEAERRSFEAAASDTASAKKELDAVRSESAGLKLRAVVALAAITALGLTETAGEAEVTKSILALNARAAKADELEPKVAKLEEEIGKQERAIADREVQFLVARGKDYGFSYDDKSRKALAAYRKADPAGFAEDHKPALDGLRAMDDPKLFAPIAGVDGKAAASVEESRAVGAEGADDDADYEKRVDAYLETMTKRGIRMLRSTAMADVLRNKDRQTA